MQYEILVLDLDGTLTNNKKEITPHTKEVLKAYQEAGGRIVLASGRPTYGVAPLAKELEMQKYHGYMLSFNGAVIIDCRTGEPIYENWLPAGVPQQLADLAEKYHTSLLTYQGDDILTETPDDTYVLKEVICTKMNVRKIENFREEITFPVVKCMLMENGVYLADVEKKVDDYFQGELSVLRSEPYFLEVMPKGIDKAASLKRLLEYLGKDRSQMIAFGDGFNDRSMLEYAGLGVAMQNGQPAIKAVADLIAPSNEDDGVAYVVESLMLGKRSEELRGFY